MRPMHEGWLSYEDGNEDAFPCPPTPEIDPAFVNPVGPDPCDDITPCDDECSECRSAISELDPVGMKPYKGSPIPGVVLILCVPCVQRHLRGVLEGDGGQ